MRGMFAPRASILDSSSCGWTFKRHIKAAHKGGRAMATTTPAPDDAIRVYWQTGCTACLRTKEFLTRHGVPFISRDVLADTDALDELERFGIRQVPIVTRRDKWANGQVLADVARIAGIPWGPQKLFPVAELQRRQDINLTAALRH